MKRIVDVVTAQRAFFATHTTISIAWRIKLLKKLHKTLKDQEQNILDALSQDLGKPIFEAQTTELLIIYRELHYALSHIKQWTKKQRVSNVIPFFFAHAAVEAQPYGCTLIISSWNYPFQLCLVPLIGAIAAGNCAIIKPSEYAPASARLIASLIDEVFDPEHVSVVMGGIEETKELLSHKFDYIFFTGSTRVGTIVAQKAALHLTPVTLELGGKNPAIITKDANIAQAAHRIAWGKCINAGQNCISPDYVMIDKSKEKDFIAALCKELLIRWSALEPGSYTRIINNAHVERLAKLMKEGTIIYGGSIDYTQRFIEPTILTNISPDSILMKEEIFGPLLPIIPYDSASEIYSMLNMHPKPLALYLFCTNKDSITEFSKIRTGAFCVNDTLVHAANHHLPFGGIGSSGMGAYHGKYTFDTFSHYKSEFISSRFTALFRATQSLYLQRILWQLLRL